ncbi:helix-turn-helix transcriptional regulator [Halotalea alkalilenta]|uniref:helix-turn-helix transcriptional regulator n=1 Tax=Halotalea alkalilenta TaxID=376489 RepID=UPI000484EEF5|nr:helix-turn-helix transcriptional regulator [Halotalea alkalilenta]
MSEIEPSPREALLLELVRQLLAGDISQGALLQRLRKEALGLSQEQYAKLVDVSRRTLSAIENGSAQPTQTVLDAVFRPLGLRSALLPRSPELLSLLLASSTPEV